MGGGSPATQSALPKLDTISLVATKASVEGASKPPNADFSVRLQLGQTWTANGRDLFTTGSWIPLSGNAPIPLKWRTEGPLKISPGHFRVATAVLNDVQGADFGAGVLRMFSCPDAAEYTPSRCGVTSLNLELAANVTPVASNVALLYWPLVYAFGCLAVATVVVQFRKQWKFAPLAKGPVQWRVGNSWAANLNAGTAIVSSFGALGLPASAFGSIATPKEYAVWTAVYVLCTVLAPTVFGLLKAAREPGGGQPPEDAGTLPGFYAANLINLTGVGGQLLLSWYGFQVLRTEKILAP